MKNIFDRMDKADAKYNRMAELRKMSNSLIEACIPEVWEDRDIRYIGSDLFKILDGYMTELQKLEGFTREQRNLMTMIYRGQFGLLYIKEKSHE